MTMAPPSVERRLQVDSPLQNDANAGWIFARSSASMDSRFLCIRRRVNPLRLSACGSKLTSASPAALLSLLKEKFSRGMASVAHPCSSPLEENELLADNSGRPCRENRWTFDANHAIIEFDDSPGRRRFDPAAFLRKSLQMH